MPRPNEAAPDFRYADADDGDLHLESGAKVYAGDTQIAPVSVDGVLAASEIINTPAGSIAATNVQSALNEIDAEKAPLSPTVRDITGATATITQADNGKILRCNRATGQTLTVTTPISSGFNCLIVQIGDGTVTVTDDATAAVNQAGGLTDTAAKYAIASLVAYDADFLALGGDLA